MRKKNLLVIVLSVLVFLSAVLLGVSSVYRVDNVFVYANTISEDAKKEANELQKLLTAEYKEKNSLFTDDEIAKTVVAGFPYFRLTSFEKAYPNRLIVRITEDEEVYAIPCDASAENYYILNAEGTVLSVRSDYTNRSDETGKAKNLLIKGVIVTGEKGKKIVGDEKLSCVFTICQKISNLLNGIRSNLTEVEISGASSNDTFTITLTTHEGVKIYIRKPFTLTETKTELAINTYMGMTDEQRTKGMLTVFDGENGVETVYFERDMLG